MARAPKRHLALRVAEADLDRIDQLAETHGLSRTEYMVRAAPGEMDEPLDLVARFDTIGRRLGRLEEFAFGT